MHQRVPVASEVAEKFADVSLNTIDAGDLAQALAPRPAGESLDVALREIGSDLLSEQIDARGRT